MGQNSLGKVGRNNLRVTVTKVDGSLLTVFVFNPKGVVPLPQGCGPKVGYPGTLPPWEGNFRLRTPVCVGWKFPRESSQSLLNPGLREQPPWGRKPDFCKGVQIAHQLPKRLSYSANSRETRPISNARLPRRLTSPVRRELSGTPRRAGLLETGKTALGGGVGSVSSNKAFLPRQ